MASLTAAHRGYEYQDLLVVCRLVDILLGTVVQVHVDEKLTVDDRFDDDLSTIGVDGHRERTQFKHTENADRPLSLGTFTTEARSLRLDLVVSSILADRSGPVQSIQPPRRSSDLSRKAIQGHSSRWNTRARHVLSLSATVDCTFGRRVAHSRALLLLRRR